MERISQWLRVGSLLCVLVLLASNAAADGRQPSFAIARASLDGFQEVPASILTDGSGTVFLFRTGNAINYVLRYANLTGDVTVAAGVHIHFGRPGVNGGITAFLCEASGVAAPPGTPQCTDDGTGSAVIRGTIRAEDVLAVDAQGFPAGSLDALWEIIANDAAYVNLHTSAFPAGEVRGAIRTVRLRGRR